MTVLSVQVLATSVVDSTDVLGGLLDGLVRQLAAEPWLGVLVVLLLVHAAIRRIPSLVHGRRQRDPQRCFLREDKRVILGRAGHRCEHHSLLGGRCRATEDLQADHVHPHSRGGATRVENGQALCPRHNGRKAARVPWTWELRRLERRREAYFPSGIPTGVLRHGAADVSPHAVP
ncbi:HNH endonuclease [Geodermatophilus arenarius]|uniref:HNH endonuclease n=1 Tax=Geodermatophilus arenarius TaxID=1137990 RepID=A0ABV9LJW7_9ACTN